MFKTKNVTDSNNNQAAVKILKGKVEYRPELINQNKTCLRSDQKSN